MAFHNRDGKSMMTLLGIEGENNLRTLYKWRKTVHDGKMVRACAGKPSFTDSSVRQRILDYVEGGNQAHCMEDIDEFIEETVLDNLECQSIEMSGHSRDYIRKTKRKLGIEAVPAQLTTQARADAESDSRNAIAFATLCVTIHKAKLHPSMILNADATQFNVGGFTSGKLRAGETTNTKKSRRNVLPSTNTKKHKNAYNIKYYLLIAANGSRADPVYIIGDDCMNPEDLDVYVVPQLASSDYPAATAYVVFMKTRVPNKKFYRWFNQTVLIPFVVGQRSRLSSSDNTVAFFTLDGETNQIGVMTEVPEVQALENNSIIVGKPPASTTHITQPCDVGNSFRGSKQALKLIKDKEIKDSPILPYLDPIFKAHVSKYSSTTSRSGKAAKRKQMSYEHIRSAKLGLLKIQRAVQGAVRRETYMDSFTKTGIYPYNANQIFDQFKLSGLSAPEKELYNEKLEDLMSALIANGELRDSDLDALSFPATRIRDKKP